MKIGAAQLRPVWLRPKQTTAKIIDAIAEASAKEIELLAFSESFLSGYPFWLCRTDGASFDSPLQKRAYAQFLDAAVEVPSEEISSIVQAARDYKVSVYLGINERGGSAARGSIFCSLLAIHRDKGLLSTHRKLVPTFDERLCWAHGDAKGLVVHQFDDFRVGGLNCWENWMPMSRFAMYAGGEDIHVSVWPGNASVSNNATKLIAIEGRVWSLNSTGLLSLSDVPEDFALYEELKEQGVEEIFTGGSHIVSPSGEVVAQAKDGVEEIIYFDADLQSVREERRTFDVSGHYYRPDIFRLSVDRSRLQALHTHSPGSDDNT
ncbi:carbon-nitrogen hydrolase family protein [Rhizobium brockwellii]|uniref:carbon-nitrogen hydrolase family protein n=1 Tax=Rhizobium TaxID=379 RepID=UPI003F9CD56C